ncbi:unnamed protein product [Schistocephalus solidus]|uniref:C2H2-type domain-containing protein n=1 Tax=Schistocephalus solidus TaxID=70667 RepID=A0A183SDL5_SCHSO|nr:unnamed protein product [Schistocephalus solidus]
MWHQFFQDALGDPIDDDKLTANIFDVFLSRILIENSTAPLSVIRGGTGAVIETMTFTLWDLTVAILHFCQPHSPGPDVIPTICQYSSPGTPTTATTTAFAFTTTTTISDGDSLLNCPQCARTFTSRIGLVGHLRIHGTQTGEPVPVSPTHSRDRRLHSPHCPRAFTNRMGLFGHIRIHDSGIHRNADNTNTSCTPSAPAILIATAISNTINEIPPASTDFSCLHCTRKFNSHIGLVGHLRIHRKKAGEPVPGAPTDLVGHLRIHRTEAGEPVPGAPTYSHRAGLHCPHCSRKFTRRMDLLGHMRLHDNLR